MRNAGQDTGDKTGWRARRDATLRANLLKRKEQAKARQETATAPAHTDLTADDSYQEKDQ